MARGDAVPEPHEHTVSPSAPSPPLREVNERLLVAALREQELKEAAEGHAAEMDALLESLHDGVVVLDPAGRVAMANDPARQLLGLSPASEDDSATDLLQLCLHGLNGHPVPAEESPFQMALRGNASRDGSTSCCGPTPPRRRSASAGARSATTWGQ